LLKEIPDLIDKKAAANLITPFRRISYKDAIQVLVTLGLETSYGDDISSQHERALLEWNSGQPLFITHFPKHGRLAHRSLTALRRRYANKPELHEPDWARAPVPRQERALLLAGRWNNDNANDRTVLSALAGKRAVTRR
jgi:hypothetical protein